MMMIPDNDTQRKQLLAAWRQLGREDRHTLLRFAEFLAHQHGRAAADGDAPALPNEPLPIPRPERESAVAGLKRLKRTYPMLEADQSFLGQASQFLMDKVMGTPDAEVIDRMEEFFAEQYSAWLKARSGATENGTA